MPPYWVLVEGLIGLDWRGYFFVHEVVEGIRD